MKEINPNKVAIYIRWSTQDQGLGTTLEVQLETCQHFIISQGWQYDENLIFIDDGYSGGNLDRPAMTKMREMVKQDKIDCIVIFKLDRLSRSVIDTVNLVLDEWENLTYLKSAREPIDTTTPMGKQFFYLLVSFAEFERSTIRERTYSGKIKRAEIGMNPGYKPPYGYKVGKTTGTYEIIEEEAEVVKLIFNKYNEGYGAKAICTYLNDKGIRFRNNRFWVNKTILYILKNEIYIGKFVYGKQMVNSKKKKGEKLRVNREELISSIDDAIPSIVDKNLFLLVQKKKESKVFSRERQSPPRINRKLLTGLLFCTCGHALKYKDRAKGDSYAYYRCVGYETKGTSFCDAGYIRSDIIEGIVIDKVKKVFLNKESNVLDNILKKKEEELKKVENFISNVNISLQKATSRLDKLDDDYFEGRIAATSYDKLHNKVSDEINKYHLALKEYRKEYDLIVAENYKDKVQKNMKLLEQWDNLDIEKKKIFLSECISKIISFRDKKINELKVKITFKWEEKDHY